MASPAYNHNYSSAISPPYPSNAQLPQPLKRRQPDMPSSAPSIKRRKASMMSTTSISSTHPLRQTSFPPENNGLTPAYSRSPSMDTVSLASASVTGIGKKKKLRKSKGKDNDDRARSATAAHEGAKGRRASRDKTAEESEEDVGGEETRLLRAKDDKKEDNKKRAMLTQHFDSDQFQRFEAWRSSKLSDATVRRLVNQTLSQSVPPAVILAIKAAAKMFAGDMIEGARKVQTEWLESMPKSHIDPQTLMPTSSLENPVWPGHDKRRAPLLPDHLREAFRRHMLEADGGLVGQLGLWQQQQQGGVPERGGVKVGGKKLFK